MSVSLHEASRICFANNIVCGNDEFKAAVRRDIRKYIQADNLISLRELSNTSSPTKSSTRKKEGRLRKWYGKDSSSRE